MADSAPATTTRQWTFDQLLYGWSQSNANGRRGFGVIAMSPGWRELLSAGEAPLGPLVAFPEPGARGAAAPAHGGFTRVNGRPVVFRRIPWGTDSLHRPGNYRVDMLLARDVDLTASAAAALLAGDWLESDPPEPDGPLLPPLTLAAPGPRRGSAAASPIACAAVLQALMEDRPLVLRCGTEPTGRAALCDALRRLPPGLGDELTFSTLEAEPARFGFDVSVAIAGWVKGPPPGAVLDVDLEGSGSELVPDFARWGLALTGATASSLRGIPDPVTPRAVGMRLDAQAKLADNPAALSAGELISVLSSPEGQAWAAGPVAPGVVRQAVADLDPELAGQLARTAQRRPAVTTLLREVGWDVLAHRSASATSGRAAENLLIGLGEPKSRIELARLSAQSDFGRADAQRYLKLAAAPGAALDPKGLTKITWDAALMQAYPDQWFKALLLSRNYRGPRASRTVVEGLQSARVGAAVSAAHELGPSDELVAARIWCGLPTTSPDRVSYLRTIAASSDEGLGIVLEHILNQKGIDDSVRGPLLREFWPVFVTELRLPRYLANSLAPVGSGSPLIPWIVGLVGVAVLAFGAGWILG